MQSLWYAVYAIFWGLMCPIFYTVKAYIIRKYSQEYEYWDLGVDALIFEQLCYCLMYGVYIYDKGWNLEEFLYGQLISLLFLVGKQTLTVAYATGPGGPVNSLVITNSLYQMLLDVFVDG